MAMLPACPPWLSLSAAVRWFWRIRALHHAREEPVVYAANLAPDLVVRSWRHIHP